MKCVVVISDLRTFLIALEMMSITRDMITRMMNMTMIAISPVDETDLNWLSKLSFTLQQQARPM